MTSANIVGYRQIQLVGGYTLMGISFDKVTGGEMSLNEAIPVSEGMNRAKKLDDADTLQVMTPSGYKVYFLSNGQSGKDTAPAYNAELDGKWLEKQGVACTATLKSGDALWYVSKTASKDSPVALTVAGAVPAYSTTGQISCSGYTLIGNPYPCDVPLDNIVTVGGTKNKKLDDSDTLQVMTDSGYKVYFLSNGQSGKDTAPAYNAELDGKWLEKQGVACTASLPAGSAFWYVSKASNTVEVKNPISK